MKTTIETITPAIAKKILDQTEDQILKGKVEHRPLSNIIVNRYARDMKAGYWLTTHQGIAFDDQGNLIDGRHRLWAIVRSNIPIEMLVTRDIPHAKLDGHTLKPIDVVDRGRVRSVGQQLVIAHGYINGTLLASTCRVIALALLQEHHTALSVGQTLEVLKVYESNIEAILNIGHGPAYILGPVAMYHYASPKLAREFATGYFSLEELQSGDPRLALFKHFIGHKARGAARNIGAKLKSACSALYAFNEHSTVASIHGSQEALDWLVKTQKGTDKLVTKLSLFET